MNNQLLVYDVLRDAANRWPDKPAIYDDYGMMTFGQLYTETETLRLNLIGLGIIEGMG